MLYTGSTNASVQVQCLAVPADDADPLLTNWTKYEGNPVLYPPPGIGPKDFRDPTTAWIDPSDGAWRVVIGSKDDDGHAGIAVVYRTTDLVHFELLPGLLHRVDGTGMWECIDFYPVATRGRASANGVDMSDAIASNGAVAGDVLHVMKASMDDDRHDYYALGRYDAAANAWTPIDAGRDVGIGLRYDWGKFYASKTFYDPAKRRRVLWGWVGETDSERADVSKGWASLQGIPRTVLLDTKTGSNLLQWPVEEVETLRTNSTDLSGITIDYGSVFPLNLRRATQLDIEAEFQLDRRAVMSLNEADVGYNCSTSGGAAGRGALGPFGLLVLADRRLRREQTAVYFYVAKGLDGSLATHFCQDESRSSTRPRSRSGCSSTTPSSRASRRAGGPPPHRASTPPRPSTPTPASSSSTTPPPRGSRPRSSSSTRWTRHTTTTTWRRWQTSDRCNATTPLCTATNFPTHINIPSNSHLSNFLISLP
ncbi:Beta-fructofuranosidase 1 [Zea mays]|uniref:Beta-fructofuranosidase 1 n=1 Tax=Zea mays TaxID=4577 RepID=A0A1D6GY30_MAIZE|nr:Beta-fructofuranosidase 1 [Zea mays]